MGDGLFEVVERAEIGDLHSDGLFGFYQSQSQFHAFFLVFDFFLGKREMQVLDFMYEN